MKWQFTKNLLTCRTGLVLVAMNLGLVVYYYAAYMYDYSGELPLMTDAVFTGRFIAGKWIDLNPLLLWILVPLNILPLLLGWFFLWLVVFVSPQLNVHAASWIQACLFLLFSTAQWFLVGYYVQRMVKLAKEALA